MAARKSAPIACVLCGHTSVLFDRESSAPVCLNRTRCKRRQRSTQVHIQQFIYRLRRLPPDKREQWVAALKEEIWRVIPRKRKKVEHER